MKRNYCATIKAIAFVITAITYFVLCLAGSVANACTQPTTTEYSISELIGTPNFVIDGSMLDGVFDCGYSNAIQPTKTQAVMVYNGRNIDYDKSTVTKLQVEVAGLTLFNLPNKA